MEHNLDFDNCYWHDSILESIFIDRRDPGNMDTIEMIIRWYDEPVSRIIFKNVYLFKATLNFGIIANESILSAEIGSENDPDLIELFRKTRGYLSGKKINCYIIETNSTGGLLKILAESVVKVPL